jgi:hypothetical protein
MHTENIKYGHATTKHVITQALAGETIDLSMRDLVGGM